MKKANLMKSIYKKANRKKPIHRKPVRGKTIRKELSAMRRRAGRYAKKFPKQMDRLLLAAFFLLVVAASIFETAQNRK